MWKAVDELLEQGVERGVFPGCAMAAGQGSRVLYTSVCGRLARDDERKVSHGTRYDVGALTQVLATVPLLLLALERGLVSLDDRIGSVIDGVPDDKKEVTLLSLLTQTSGMSPHFMLAQEAENDREALNALLKHPLAGPVGAKVRDSAMGFILLGALLERVYQMPLDEAFKRFVSAPLSMGQTGFLPSGDDIAASESEHGVDGPPVGVPYDGNARFLHGVAGHAGLFATLEDLINFTAMLAANGRTADGVFLSDRAVHLATTERTRGLNAARGYGFHIMKRSDPFLGHLWPSEGYGLSDPASGSLIAVSPDDGFYVALLANVGSATRDRREMERTQKLLLNAAYAAFQREE